MASFVRTRDIAEAVAAVKGGATPALYCWGARWGARPPVDRARFPPKTRGENAVLPSGRPSHAHDA